MNPANQSYQPIYNRRFARARWRESYAPGVFKYRVTAWRDYRGAFGFLSSFRRYVTNQVLT